MSLPFKSSRLILSSLLILCIFPITSTFATETNSSTNLERYQQALKVDPDNPTLHYILGLAQLRNGNNDAAIASFVSISNPKRTRNDPTVNLRRAIFVLLRDPSSEQVDFDDPPRVV